MRLKAQFRRGYEGKCEIRVVDAELLSQEQPHAKQRRFAVIRNHFEMLFAFEPLCNPKWIPAL